jgi:hypothetical protein
MKRLVQNFLAAALGLFSAIYLLNPGAGGVEFISDIFPIVGNLDEATAVLILIRCLAYFGLDLSFLTRFRGKETPPERGATPHREPARTREKVIDV